MFRPAALDGLEAIDTARRLDEASRPCEVVAYEFNGQVADMWLYGSKADGMGVQP